MPFEIVVPGDINEPEDQFDQIVDDPTVRQFQCPNCGAVIAGTNKDVYDAMTLFGRPLAKDLARQRFQRSLLFFVCPECGESGDFTRIDPEHERPVPPPNPGPPDNPGPPAHPAPAQGQ